MQLWDIVEDLPEVRASIREVCRGCASKSRHLEDGYCPRCNATPLESDEVIMARKRQVRPEWFDADGNYDPFGRR
jgi:hypothetical protein